MRQDETASLAARVRDAMRTFRDASPLTILQSPAGVFYTISRWEGSPYAQPMVWLASSGCSHVTARGGCTMCDFGRGDHGWEDILGGLEGILDGLRGAPLVHLFPSGSFLDRAEVPSEIARRAFEMAVERGVRELGIESRPEYVTEEVLRNLLRPYSGVSDSSLRSVSIGLGVECFDETVGAVCINKNSSRRSVERALEAIASARGELAPLELVAEAHVLLKPPAFTEREAIEDAVAAVNWCFEAGFGRVILMPCSAKPGSVLSKMAFYQPPSLWSAIEVLSRVSENRLADMRIHGFASSTPIGIGSATCPACQESVVALAQFFNATGARDALDAVGSISCECKRTWHEGLQSSPEDSLDARIVAFVGSLERIALHHTDDRPTCVP